MLDIEENLINIYKITNLKNNYIYVGSTSKSIQERFREHCKPSTWKKSPNSNFYKDIEKYGKESFEVELLDTCFERHRYIIEQYWWNKLFEEEYLMYDIKMGSANSHNTKQRIALSRSSEDRDKTYHTEDFKYHVSLATSGELNGMYGKKDENAINGRIVVAYRDKEHTEKAYEFISQKVALKFLNIKGHIGMNNACKNNTLYYGYYWTKEWINR